MIRVNYISQLESEVRYEAYEVQNLDDIENEYSKGTEKQYPLYFKNCTFSVPEVACLISGYSPTAIEGKYNHLSWLKDNPKFEEALDFVWSAVRGDMFEEVYADYFVIESERLKGFLAQKEFFIEGFNTHLKPSNESQEKEFKSLIVDNLKKEIELLKLEISDQDKKIKVLESIQTRPEEAKLSSTRAENNVAKLLSVLAEMANIDINKPHAIHQSLLTQADLLGIDKFPSDKTVKKWLRKANEHRDSQNPN